MTSTERKYQVGRPTLKEQNEKLKNAVITLACLVAALIIFIIVQFVWYRTDMATLYEYQQRYGSLSQSEYQEPAPDEIPAAKQYDYVIELSEV